MNLPAYARAAARLLRGNPEPAGVPSAAARARSLSTIERALVDTQRRRRWWGPGAFVAAAAVVALVVHSGEQRTASRQPPPPGPTSVTLSVASSGSGAWVTTTRGTLPLTQQVQLSAGSSVSTTGRGNAVFRSSTGTALTLGQEGRVSVASVGLVQRFRLAQGALDATVAKLKPGERFVIETVDAVVEVRGTAFRVSVLEEPALACAGSVRTSVRVSEGVVNVQSRGQSLDLRAGASWPEPCDDEREPTPAVDADALRKEPGAPRAEAPARPQPAAAAEHASEPEKSPERASVPIQQRLALQNDKFALAVRARQQGDFATALGAYRDFVREFPASPLAQNARVEVMRLLLRSDKAAAAHAARDYLQRYPTGFARAEAERLIATP